MRSLLELAAELGLEPGQSRTETAGDRIVRLSVEAPKLELVEQVMFDAGFVVPPPQPVGMIRARYNPAPPILDPVQIDEWDRAPE